MKKIALSVGVIVCFIGYSLFMRHPSDDVHVSLPMQPTGGTPSPTSAGSESTNNNSTDTSSNSSNTSSPSSNTYKDGTFVGSVADAFYGNIQVEAIIQSGKITDVQFLQYPNDRSDSIQINQQAMPYLKEEAIQAQSARVDGVTGATDTSQAFVESLSSALAKAQNA